MFRPAFSLASLFRTWAQALKLEPGLKLVLAPGVPGPWSEGAKGLFHVKGIDYARVRQRPGEPNADLVAWTGHANAPQAILDDEPARTAWTELRKMLRLPSPKY